MSKTRRKLREDWKERLRSVGGKRASSTRWSEREKEEALFDLRVRDEMMQEMAHRLRKEFDFQPEWD